MKELTITVMEAALNFSDCVNRAHYQNTSFVLLKNGRPSARIVPDSERRCTGRDSADALVRTDLSVDEARDWHSGLRTARETLPAPTDKWQ